MPAPVFGALVPLVGRVNTAVLAINQVRWFKWSLFYQEYVAQGYADIHDPAEPGVVVALKIDGTAATYSALPTAGLTAGTVYVVGDTGRAYVWSGTGWPAVGAGIAIQGPRGYTGNGVESVSVAGNSLVFHMTDGNNLPPIFLQVLADLKEFADTATEARDAAIGARNGAESARDSAVASAADALAHRNAAQSTYNNTVSLHNAAVQYRNDAQTAASTAATKAGDASVSATNSASSATTAATKAGEAIASAVNASTSASTASTKAGEATTAKINAESARDAAVVARQGAETARDQAIGGVVPDNGVSTSKIVNGAVTLQKLANNSVDKDKIVVGGVVTDNLAAGTVTDAKVAAAAAIAQSKISGLVPDLLKKADLDAGGKILQAQLPALALTEHLGAVASQSAMLALVGQRGDWCTRTDLGSDWQLIAEPSSSLASWRQHTYPASPVSSVAGRTGPITLSAADITDTTATGRGVMKATDAAAARNAIGAYQKPANGIPGLDIAYGEIQGGHFTEDVLTVFMFAGLLMQAATQDDELVGIPRNILVQDVRDDLAAGASAYQKPAAGIPGADIAANAGIAFSKLSGIPFEMIIVHSSSTRKVGMGDLIVHMPVSRRFALDSVLYQFGTPDASGSTQCTVLRNSIMVGNALTVSAANQVDGTATDAARTMTVSTGNEFPEGSRIGLNIGSVGTTPGKVLLAVIKGRYL